MAFEMGAEFDVKAIVRHRGITLTTREWEEILPIVWKAAGVYWHSTIVPRHFTHAGATRYAYATRTHGYERRKLKRFGHTYPLVYSGKTRSAALSIRDVRADRDGVKIVLRNIPNYVWMSQHRRAPAVERMQAEAEAMWRQGKSAAARRKEGRAKAYAALPNMVSELTRRTDDDLAAIARVIDQAFGDEIQRRDTANQLMLIGQEEAMGFGV